MTAFQLAVYYRKEVQRPPYAHQHGCHIIVFIDIAQGKVSGVGTGAWAIDGESLR